MVGTRAARPPRLSKRRNLEQLGAPWRAPWRALARRAARRIARRAAPRAAPARASAPPLVALGGPLECAVLGARGQHAVAAVGRGGPRSWRRASAHVGAPRHALFRQLRATLILRRLGQRAAHSLEPRRQHARGAVGGAKVGGGARDGGGAAGPAAALHRRLGFGALARLAGAIASGRAAGRWAKPNRRIASDCF